MVQSKRIAIYMIIVESEIWCVCTTLQLASTTMLTVIKLANCDFRCLPEAVVRPAVIRSPLFAFHNLSFCEFGG